MDKIAAGESVTVLPTLIANYEKYGVEQYLSHKVERIETGKLVCKNGNDESVEIPCDYVVMAVGASSVAFPAELLEQAGIRVVRVGDCSRVRQRISIMLSRQDMTLQTLSNKRLSKTVSKEKLLQKQMSNLLEQRCKEQGIIFVHKRGKNKARIRDISKCENMEYNPNKPQAKIQKIGSYPQPAEYFPVFCTYRTRASLNHLI